MVNKDKTTIIGELLRKELKLGDRVKILGTKCGSETAYNNWIEKNADDCCIKFLKKKGYLYVTKLSNENVFVSCKSNHDLLDGGRDWTLNYSDISPVNDKESVPFVPPSSPKLSIVEPIKTVKKMIDIEEVTPQITFILNNQITLPRNVVDYELEELFNEIKNAVDSMYERYSASTFREFMINKCVIWCKTIQQANDLIQKLDNMQIFNIDKDIKMKLYGNICFGLDLATNEIVFNTFEHYKQEKKKIVKF